MSMTLPQIEESNEIKMAIKIIKSTNLSWLERDINCFLCKLYEGCDKYDIVIHQSDVKIGNDDEYIGIIRYSKLLTKSKVSLEK